MHISNRVLWVTLALSLFAHGLLYGWLHVQRQIPVSGKHGVVSVSFVQSVTHETHAPAPARVLKPKSDAVNPHPAAAKTAPAEATPPQPVAAQGDPAQIENAASAFGAAIAALVTRKRIYPQAAIDREEQGKVVIGITLARDGTVITAVLEEPSAFRSLNEAALKTVQAVGRFPPVPDLLSVPIHLHVPIAYRIEGN